MPLQVNRNIKQKLIYKFSIKGFSWNSYFTKFFFSSANC